MTQDLKDIIKRLDKLESVVFTKTNSPIKTKTNTKLAGPSGGVNFLTSKGYFSKKRTTSEVMAELANHDYHYRMAAIQTALNRAATKRGPLTSFKEAGKKVYVIRK